MNRRQRGGNGQHVPPDYNTPMEDKFKEIWCSERNNPFQGANMTNWCKYAMAEYEKWRWLEIDNAITEKRPTPPLNETNFALVLEWAKKMKQFFNKTVRDGAFNEDSSELNSQLKAFTKTSSPAKALNLGETTVAADLSVTVATAVVTSATKFPPPTSATVQKGMDAVKPSETSEPKKKKRKKDPPSEEFLRRQKAAAETMASHGITADVNEGKRKRCKVCGVMKSGFYFHKEHGKSTEADGGVPHLNTRSREAPISFCPLADDHTIYYEYQQLCQHEKSERNKRSYRGS